MKTNAQRQADYRQRLRAKQEADLHERDDGIEPLFRVQEHLVRIDERLSRIEAAVTQMVTQVTLHPRSADARVALRRLSLPGGQRDNQEPFFYSGNQNPSDQKSTRNDNVGGGNTRGDLGNLSSINSVSEEDKEFLGGLPLRRGRDHGIQRLEWPDIKRAFVAGVASATGSAYLVADGHQRAIDDVVDNHCPDLRSRMRWVAIAAEEWALWATDPEADESERRFRPLTPSGFVAWANQGMPCRYFYRRPFLTIADPELDSDALVYIKARMRELVPADADSLQEIVEARERAEAEVLDSGRQLWASEWVARRDRHYVMNAKISAENDAWRSRRLFLTGRDPGNG